MSPGVSLTNRILLVESDDRYAALISEAFDEMGLLDHVEVCADCEDAFARLRRSGGSRPQLILLDLELPQRSAFAFLEAVKADSTFQMIPVVALAARDDADDIITCYGLGVAGYLLKSADSPGLRDKIRIACGYWSLNRAPVI